LLVSAVVILEFVKRVSDFFLGQAAFAETALVAGHVLYPRDGSV
jgi:hypothetical protein